MPNSDYTLLMVTSQFINCFFSIYKLYSEANKFKTICYHIQAELQSNIHSSYSFIIINMIVDKLEVPSKRSQIESFEHELVKQFSELANEHIGNIKSIKLTGNSYSKQFYKELSQLLLKATVINTLHLDDTFVARKSDEIPQSIQVLAKSLIGKEVTYLNISNNAVGPSGAKALLHFLQQASRLKTFLISNCGLGILGITEIAKGLKGTPALESLSVTRNRLMNQGALQLAKVVQFLPNLRVLHILQNGIAEAFSQLLKELHTHCPNLQNLDICDNRLKGQSTVEMATLIRKSKNLKYLNLSDCLDEDQNDQILEALQTIEEPRFIKLGFNYSDLTEQQGSRLLKIAKKHPLTRFDIVGNQLPKKLQKLYIEELKQKNIKLKFEDDEEQEEDELANALSQLTI